MFTIQRNALKAVSRFAGDRDVRHCLNGVLAECSPEETRLVATDGHTLAAHRFLTPDDKPNGGHCAIIVPNDAIKAVLKWKFPKRMSDAITLSGSGDKWTLSALDQTVDFKPIDGRFPDYSRVIPSTISGETGQFNPDYLVRCMRAAEDLRGDGAFGGQIGHNGESGNALVNVGDPNFVVVVMPIRKPALPSADSAAWARQPVATAPAPLKAVA